MPFGIDSWSDLGSLAVGGPLGLVGKKAYDKQQDGNDAQMASMQQAQTQLAQLQKDQQARRQSDLQRALGYFAPADSLMYRMYGTPLNGSMKGPIAAAMAKGQDSGPGRPGLWSLGGASPPPSADAMFAPPGGLPPGQSYGKIPGYGAPPTPPPPRESLGKGFFR